MKIHLPALSLVALAALSGRTVAQQLIAPFPLPEVHSAPALAPGSEVLHITYDVEEDRIREIRSEPWGRIGLGNTPCFDNSELSGDPDIGTSHWVTPHPGEELVSWGFKFCRESGLVRRVTIGFGSNAEDPSSGGPGGAFSFALYQGTQGFGVLGTEVFRRTISGLPNNHGHTPMLLTIDFGTQPLRLADGNIGWGFLQLDGLTGPFLVRAPRRIIGTTNAMDLYSIGPASRSEYRGTFNYGDQACTDPWFSLCASQWLQIEEVPAREVAGSVIRNGSGVNPVLLHETLPARLGQLWAANLIALDPQGNRLPTVLFLSNSGFGPQASRFGELLIDLNQQIGHPRVGNGGYVAPIPAELALAGRRIFMQGFVQDPAGEFLTNALRVTVGY